MGSGSTLTSGTDQSSDNPSQYFSRVDLRIFQIFSDFNVWPVAFNCYVEFKSNQKSFNWQAFSIPQFSKKSQNPP